MNLQVYSPSIHSQQHNNMEEGYYYPPQRDNIDGKYEKTKRDLNVGVNAYLSVEGIYASNFRNALNFFSYATAFFVAANNEFFRLEVLNNTSDHPVIYFLMVVISLLCLLESAIIQWDNYKEYKVKKKMFDRQKIRLRLSQDQTLRMKKIISFFYALILFLVVGLCLIVGILIH